MVWYSLRLSLIYDDHIQPSRSFDSSMAHGTVLPCKAPLESMDIAVNEGGDPGGGDRPPPRISSGIHVTKTKRNTNAAKKYRAVRLAQQNVEEYWKG